MFSAESLFVNTITSGQLNIGNLVGRCIVKKTRPSSNFKVMDPTPGPHPEMWLKSDAGQQIHW